MSYYICYIVLINRPLYTFNHINNSTKEIDCIEIINSQTKSYAKISLTNGGSLQELSLNNNILIEDLAPLQYKDTYASAILFPFANRIKNGTYSFNHKQYQFDINETDRNNALHGLVFNKKFEIVNKQASENSASVKLIYNEENKSIGFPFTYTIQIEYILTKNALSINVSILNTDTKAFPFTLGWHPYFLSSDLFNSSLSFNSNKKVVFDDRMITSDIKTNPDDTPFKIKNKQLDDCWVLERNDIVFSTPDYKLALNSSEKDSFLQVYTPPKANTIAIEPTTGISDSFNNKIGLKTLNPKESYNVTWQLLIK